MSGAARQGDSIAGMTNGEHEGHFPPHPPGPLTGTIVGACSSNVFINGKSAAMVSSTTDESDNCDSGQQGTVSGGSSNVFVNGQPLARIGDRISPHNGTANITSGSDNVIIGG